MAEETVLHIKIDIALLEKLEALASRQKTDINQVIVNAIRLHLKLEKEREWLEGFEAMAIDPDCNDVEYAVGAIREVIFGD